MKHFKSLVSLVGLMILLSLVSRQGLKAEIQQNLLVNPSFEYGPSPVPWVWIDSGCNMYAYDDSGVAHGGSRYLATNRANDPNCKSFQQDINQTPIVGNTYRFAIWARSSDGSTRTGRIAVWALGPNQQSSPQSFSTNSTDWQCFETSLTVSNSGNTALRAEIYLDTLDGADYYFDDADFRISSSSLCPDNSDSYEPDNISGQANWITSGSLQSHSIVPADDIDWVKFSLNNESSIVLYTTTDNPSIDDTRIWLYDGNLNQIDYNDDWGDGRTSRIDRECNSNALSAGTYYVKVDEYQNNDEIDDYTLSFSATGCLSDDKPDLIVESLTIDSITSNSITYSYVIKNIGDAPANLDGPTNQESDNVSIQAFLSQDQIFNNSGDSPAGGTILGLSPLGELAPGEDFTGSFSAGTSVNPADMQYLVLKVDWGEVVDESDETNNTLAAPIQSTGKPDLIVSALTVTNFDTGSIAYEYTITNIGTTAANLDGPTDENFDNVGVQAFLSQDQIFNNSGDSPAGGTILGLSPLGELAPDESFTGSFQASTTNPATMNYLTLKVDYGNVIDELDETNNTIATPIEVSSDECLQARFVSMPSVGGSITVFPEPNCPTDNNRYVVGTTIQLVANPNSGYLFDEWYATGLIGNSNSSVNLTLNGNSNTIYNIYAKFTEDVSDIRVVDWTVSFECEVDQVYFNEVFNHFADALYEMSNGAHKVGTITAYQNGINTDSAHVVWHCESGRANAAINGYHNGGHINMYGNNGNACAQGYTWGHEAGHYWFGMFDEYREVSGQWDDYPYMPHSDDIPVEPSVMHNQYRACAGGSQLSWLNFSTPVVATDKNAQRRVWGTTAWPTLSRPLSQDPRHDDLDTSNFRTYYPELSSFAPETGQHPSIEIPAQTSQARSNLNIVWATQMIQRAAIDIYASTYLIGGNAIVYPAPMLIETKVMGEYPIHGITIDAIMETPTSNRFEVTFTDNGIAPDAVANDGLYSALVPYHENGEYSLSISFSDPDAEAYYTSVAYVGSDVIQEPVNTAISVNDILVINVSGVFEEGSSQSGMIFMPTDNSQIVGQIDAAGDVDTFTFIPSTTGEMIFRVNDLAFDMMPEVILLNNSSELIAWGNYDPAGKYLQVPFSANADNVYTARVYHQDANATSGLYHVSVGAVLESEQSPSNTVYLPLIIK